MATLYNLLHLTKPPKIPKDISENCSNFLKCCLEYILYLNKRLIPNKRKNVCKLLKHPFITNNSSDNINSNMPNPFSKSKILFENQDYSKHR